MMTSNELRALLKRALAESGFTRQGEVWLRRSSELIWIIEIDRSPYADRFSLDMGVSLLRLLAGGVPAKANDCQILLHLENLRLSIPVQAPDARLSDFHSVAKAAFDLTVDMEDEERTLLIEAIIGALTGYIRNISDEIDLRSRYDAGDFMSAFIRKDVKRVLASD
jgi:hypothetical protein